MITLRNRNANIATPRPNWSNPVGVEYVFKTNIITSRDGHEQREAQRQTARVALKFTTAMTRSLMARHQGDMAKGQLSFWAVRAEWAWVRIASDHTSGGLTIDVDSVPHWMVAEQKVILETSTDEDLTSVAAVSGTTITLGDVTTKDYPAGTKVFLAYWTRTAASASFTAQTSRLWTGAVRYDVSPADGVETMTPPFPFTFGYANMLLNKPNWREAPKITFKQERDVFDPGSGLIDVFAPHDSDPLQMQFGFTGLSVTQSEELVSFFKLMKGRRGSFWMPTWMDDLEPSDTQIDGANKFKIEGEDFRNAYDGHGIYQTMIAFYDDCTYQANTILNISGTVDSEITFENAWSQEINSATKIYWLVRCRFDSDVLDVRWVTNETAEVQYTVLTMLHDKTPQQPIPAAFISLLSTEYEAVDWGDLPVESAVPTKMQHLVRLSDLGITAEQIDAGDVVALSRFAGSYQEGAPLVDNDTTFGLDIVFHHTLPINWFEFVVPPLGGDVTSISGLQGPVVDIELAPVTVPPTARYVSFRADYVDAATSSLILTESTWGFGRPTTGSFAGTSLDKCG